MTSRKQRRAAAAAVQTAPTEVEHEQVPAGVIAEQVTAQQEPAPVATDPVGEAAAEAYQEQESKTPATGKKRVIVSPDMLRGGVPLSAVLVSVKPNPKQPSGAAHARYSRYPSPGATVEDILKIEDGPTRADMAYDARHGHIVLRIEDERAETQEALDKEPIDETEDAA